VQCGYCTPGMVLQTVALLQNHPKPTDTDRRWPERKPVPLFRLPADHGRCAARRGEHGKERIGGGHVHPSPAAPATAASSGRSLQ
jgi:hypothetical protein